MGLQNTRNKIPYKRFSPYFALPMRTVVLSLFHKIY